MGESYSFCTRTKLLVTRFCLLFSDLHGHQLTCTLLSTMKPIAVLALVGFLLNCQPSEPFLSPYIETNRQVTHDQLVQTVYPVNTFSSLLLILPAGICAQRFGSLPVIYVGLLARQATRALLLFGVGVLPMSLAQVTYGLATSVNQAVWYAYVYSIVRSTNYERGTMWIRGGYSFGNVVGCFAGQIMVTYFLQTLRSMFWISWILTSAGCVVAVLWLPKPTEVVGAGEGEVPLLQSIVVPDRHNDHQEEDRDDEIEQQVEEDMYAVVHRGGCPVLWQHMKKLLRYRAVVVWSVAWWLAQATNVLVSNYYTASYLEADGHGACKDGSSSSVFPSTLDLASSINVTSFDATTMTTTTPSSSSNKQHPFGLLEGMNQIAATLSVALPLLIASTSSSSATTPSSSTATTLSSPSAAASSSSLRRAACLSTSLLMLCGLFLLVSTITSCDASLLSLSYATFVAYTGTFSALMAWSSIELSRASTEVNGGVGGRQSLLFGANGFVSLLLASLTQAVAVGTELTARQVLLLCVFVLAAGGLVLSVLVCWLSLRQATMLRENDQRREETEGMDT